MELSTSRNAARNGVQNVNEPEARKNIQEAMRGVPSGYFVILPQAQTEEAFDLATLFSVLVHSWKILLAVTLAGALIAAAVALLLPPTYRADALIAPVAQNDIGGVGGGLRGQLGGLAALAGIDLGSNGSRREESIATLSSKGFARDFILHENLIPILFARLWDANTGHWRGDKKAPTVEDAVKKFTTEVLTISEDRKSGLVTLTVEWRSPAETARWANKLVEMVNERLSAEATRNAERAIDYLNKEMAKTNVVELRQSISKLIEQQINNAMLANVQREYAFHFIDAAVQPESRARPKRTAMTIIGAMAGLFFGVIGTLLRFRLRGSDLGAVDTTLVRHVE
jgi:uncharacterized protein involved in exopolysaccharide biosynthesis